MRSPLKWFAGALLCLCLLLPQTAHAVGQVSARLRGKVIEQGTNVPVPNAKVEIRSSELIGGPRSVLTDEEGRFDFVNIPPGTYQITILFEGIKPVRRKASVALGETQELDIPFSAEMAEVEEQKIIEERPRIDPDRTSIGRVLTAEQQAKMATPRTYQSIVQQVPGVTGGGNPNMGGGSFRHNRYLVDGLDITDPVTNTFSANFNFDAIAQVEALVVPMDARYNSLGGIINLITKRGGDKFQVDSSFYLNHQALSAGGLAGTRLYEGRRLDQSDPRPPFGQYQVNLNVGGPIVKQKLWFYFSTEFRYTLSSVVPGPPLNTQHASRIFWAIYPRLKLTWAVSQRSRLEWSFSADPAFISNLRQSNNYADRAEYHQNQGGFFSTVNYDWFVKDNFVVSIQGGYIFQNLRITPENGDLINSAYNDRISLITHNAADAYRNQDDQRHRIQFDPMITWIKKGWLGTHTFTAGAQFAYLRHYQLFSTPGNMTFTDDTNQVPDRVGGVGVLARPTDSRDLPASCNVLQPNPLMGSSATPCFRINYYEPVQALVRTGWSLGGFIQDQWKPTEWLTLVPGFRVDYGTFQNSLGQTVQNLLGFGPRFGVSIRLTRDGKTYLKANYGRANEVSTLLFAASADTGAYSSTWQYNRATRRFDSFLFASGGPDGYDLKGRCQSGADQGKATFECGNQALNMSPPRTDSVTASIARELYASVIGEINYTFRLHQNLWEDIELNAFFTLDGGRYASPDPRYGVSVYGYRPTPVAWRRYNAIDFVLRKEPTQSSGWFAFVAYTLSFLDGTVDDQISALSDDPPRDFLFRGYLGSDARHMLKAQATYTWRGLAVGGSLNYTSGTPLTRLYLQDDRGYTGRYGWRGVDPGADPNDVKKWSEMRTPGLLLVDVRAQYDLHDLIRQHVSLIIDIFNAWDLAAASSIENRNAPTFGTVTNRQAPFRVQLGIRYQY